MCVLNILQCLLFQVQKKWKLKIHFCKKEKKSFYTLSTLWMLVNVSVSNSMLVCCLHSAVSNKFALPSYIWYGIFPAHWHFSVVCKGILKIIKAKVVQNFINSCTTSNLKHKIDFAIRNVILLYIKLKVLIFSCLS